MSLKPPFTPAFAPDTIKPLPTEQADVTDADPVMLAQNAFRTPNKAKGDIPWDTLAAPRPLTHSGLPFKNLRTGK